MTSKRVYLDHNATTPVLPEVVEAVVDVLRWVGNPSSIHREGQRARAAVERARGQVAALIGAAPSEIVFTSGATEANNLALATLAASSDVLLSTTVEHPSVIEPLAKIGRAGRRVVLAEVDGEGRLAEAEALIGLGEDHRAVAMSVMLANNEVGTIYPVAELSTLARAKGWRVHCDAVQALGKIPVDVEELGVDLLSISGHKFGGPAGAGALFVRRGIEAISIVAGGHQERGRRSGTENVAGIVGLGVAAQCAQRRGFGFTTATAALRDGLWREISEIDPSAIRQGCRESCLPNTLNVRFDGVSGETLAMNLDLDGVAVSAGSACSSGSLDPSHVLLAMGVPYQAARGSVRFSLGFDTARADIDAVVARLPRVLMRTRQEN